VGYQLVIGLSVMGDKKENTPNTDVMVQDTVVIP
jgi:flagellar basal body P-ring protein FlgI